MYNMYKCSIVWFDHQGKSDGLPDHIQFGQLNGSGNVITCTKNT